MVNINHKHFSLCASWKYLDYFLPSEIFCSLDNIWASFCCLSASSPLPLKSTLNNAMMESTILKKGYMHTLGIFRKYYSNPYSATYMMKSMGLME